ncbi:MAG: hypothetical protein ACLQLO_32905, partial [Mycobacterium sp.]
MAHSIIAGLRQPGLRNLNFAVGEVMQCAKLAYELIGVGVSHGFLLKISGFVLGCLDVGLEVRILPMPPEALWPAAVVGG